MRQIEIANKKQGVDGKNLRGEKHLRFLSTNARKSYVNIKLLLKEFNKKLLILRIFTKKGWRPKSLVEVLAQCNF